MASASVYNNSSAAVFVRSFALVTLLLCIPFVIFFLSPATSAARMSADHFMQEASLDADGATQAKFGYGWPIGPMFARSVGRAEVSHGKRMYIPTMDADNNAPEDGVANMENYYYDQFKARSLQPPTGKMLRPTSLLSAPEDPSLPSYFKSMNAPRADRFSSYFNANLK